MDLSSIFNIAQICHLQGVTDAVLSPGSRCAPLTLAFVRNQHIDCKTISDERSAAFIALGMSQQSGMPTALVCTSGSAAYNYAPAVAEAYFQQIPLLILTADRPPEWIDQLDGQTIRQTNIYGNHVKTSYTFPTDLSHSDAKWHANRIVSEALNTAKRSPKGPVHINIPFREPFYPSSEKLPQADAEIKVIQEAAPYHQLSLILIDELSKKWSQNNRILIIGGQQPASANLSSLLQELSQKQKVPVIGDIVSNLHGLDNKIAHADVFLGKGKQGLWESLQPDLMITFGMSTISKNLKLALREFGPVEHWHIQPTGDIADTFQSLTQHIPTDPLVLFDMLNNLDKAETFDSQKQENYYHVWQIEERKAQRLLENFFPQGGDLGEFEAIREVIDKLGGNINLHLANSMAVRYANYVGLRADQSGIEVFANRGTSGIDGSVSTAVGSALRSPGKQTILLTGDMAFFYDRNAFWHNYELDNLKVLLLNNHAGGIFRMINGPAEQPELKEYFETNQRLTAKHLAKEHNINYLHCDKRSKLGNYVKELLAEKGPVILEVESDSAYNKEILESFKQAYLDTK